MKPPGFESRWPDAQAAIIALAQKCEELDPDGITIYVSNNEGIEGSFKQYRQVKSAQIEGIFAENYPPDELELLKVLQLTLEDYFDRKASGLSKPNGAIVIVLIDGEPRDRLKIAKVIVDAANKLDSDEELGIGFAQIGDNLIARGFLTALDDNLRQTGAKFDIVHTSVLEEISPDCLTNFLMDIIRD
jgi:hypothetical protein